MKEMETEGQEFETVGDAFSQLQDNLKDIRQLYKRQKSNSERIYGNIGNLFNRWQYNTPSDLDPTEIGDKSYRRLGRAFEATEHILDNEEDFKSTMDQIEDEIFSPEGDKVEPAYADHVDGEIWYLGLNPTANFEIREDTAVEDYTSMEKAVMELSDAVRYLSKDIKN